MTNEMVTNYMRMTVGILGYLGMTGIPEYLKLLNAPGKISVVFMRKRRQKEERKTGDPTTSIRPFEQGLGTAQVMYGRTQDPKPRKPQTRDLSTPHRELYLQPRPSRRREEHPSRD